MGEPSVRYVRGHPEQGQSHGGFDCSGFVGFVLRRAGLTIPDFIGSDGVRRPIRHVNEFWDHYGVAVHEPLPGDLIFFSRNGTFPTHIGIVLSSETYIHSPGVDGSVVALRAIARKVIRRREDQGRQLYATNPIGFKSPTVAADDVSYRRHQAVI